MSSFNPQLAVQLLIISIFSGCKTEWDEIGCWLRAEVGQVVNLSCSEVFQLFSSNQGRHTSLRLNPSRTKADNGIDAFDKMQRTRFWNLFPILALLSFIICKSYN